jgi:hypothetical protein
MTLMLLLPRMRMMHLWQHHRTNLVEMMSSLRNLIDPSLLDPSPLIDPSLIDPSLLDPFLLDPSPLIDPSLAAPSNQSRGDDVIPKKRSPPKTPKSLNEKEFLVENRVPRVARRISYLQLEIYYVESGWAFKTPSSVESGPQPPPSAPAQLRAVWCT